MHPPVRMSCGQSLPRSSETVVVVGLSAYLFATDQEAPGRSARSGSSLCPRAQPGAHSREGPGNLLNQHEQNVHTSELRTVPTSSAWTPPSKAMVLLLGAVFLSVKWGKVVIQEFPQPPSPGQRGSGKAPGATVPPGGQIENSSPQVKRLQDECLQLLYKEGNPGTVRARTAQS